MTRQRATRPPLDEGITLIEVMVAMLVFAILASGVVAGMATISRLTADSRARVVAANLASQDLDLVRAIGDPFQISASPKKAVTVGLRTFYVQRAVSWVSSAGVDLACNSSTNLFYLRVNTRVTWDGQLSTTQPVQNDTIIAPAGRVSAESTGAISISVVDAAGEPEPGIAVSIAPVSSASGKALTTQPASTTAAGCTYATNISPGTYRATLTKTGWIDPAGSASPYYDITVTAGTTQAQQFQFDQAATYTTTYPAVNGLWTGSFAVPSNLQTTFLNTSLPSGRRVTSPTATSVKLFPYASGYSALAGADQSGTTNCASVDPAAWAAGTSNGVALANGVRSAVAVPAGGSGPLAVPVGIVRVTAPKGYVLGATQATATGAGNPGCGITGTIYTYSATTTGGTMTIALPFGSWKIYYGTTTGNATQVTAANLVVPTNAAGAGVAADGTVTLDPRAKR